MIVANPELPAKNVAELIALAKASPGRLNFASSGNGQSTHLSAELFASMAGVKMTHIPYKGSAPAMTDLMGGQIPFSIDTVSAAIPQLKSGKIKAIALTTAKRSALLPDVPTFAESGYASVDMDSWLMIAVPKGVPADVKAKLEKALAATIADPETRTKLLGQGLEPAFSSSAASSELINRDRKSTRLNSSHFQVSRMPSSA